jgi:hypothetical protein
MSGGRYAGVDWASEEQRRLRWLSCPSDHVLPQLIVYPRERSIPDELLDHGQLISPARAIDLGIESEKR